MPSGLNIVALAGGVDEIAHLGTGQVGAATGVARHANILAQKLHGEAPAFLYAREAFLQGIGTAAGDEQARHGLRG